MALITASGMHILAVIHFERGRLSIYDTYKFRLRNLAGDILELLYKVPGGGRPARLIRDLIELYKLGLFARYNLRENNGMLAITSITEPEMPQDELRAHMPESQRVVESRY